MNNSSPLGMLGGGYIRRSAIVIGGCAAAFAVTECGPIIAGQMSPAVARQSPSDPVAVERIIGNGAQGQLCLRPGPGKLEPLTIALPIPTFHGTPSEIPPSEHLEKPSETPRPPFLAPAGVVNVAARKKVVSSDLSPLTGSLDLITDGDKEANDGSYVELHRKLQWVQIDMEVSHSIYAIVIWHAHDMPQVYRDVVVQVSDDADFTRNVRTVFNNDYDNSAGLGIGSDKEYFENYEGRLIDAKGIAGRFVRLYSKGGTSSALNRYTEVEVYGSPEAKVVKNGTPSGPLGR